MANLFFIGWAAVSGWSAGPPVAGRQTTQVDLIELNHFLDDEGREVFRQLIFYDWSDQQQRFLVRGWRLVKSPEQLPKQTWNPRGHYVAWQENGATRRVEAVQHRETWTQRDPEKENRRWLPEDQRIPLWPATKSRTR